MSGGSELPELPSFKPATDAKKQWIKHVVNAAGVVHRLEQDTGTRRADPQGTAHKANSRSVSKFKQNQPPVLDLTRCCGNDPSQPEEDSAHEVLKNTHKALYERLNMYGFVFVLLGSITFVAILQPPGGFDSDGHLRSNILVSCFVFFSTLSFLFTFIGLFGVVVGFLSLFRPSFYLKFETRMISTKSSQSGISHMNLQRDESGSLTSCPSSLLYNKEGMDDLKVLAKLLWDNLERMWRLRIYLILSLALIVCAFGCGVFSIIGADHRNTYLLAGAIIVGLVALVFEVFRTVQGIHTYHKSKWLKTFQTYYPNANLPSEMNTPGEKLVGWLEGFVHPGDSSAPTQRRVHGLSNLGPGSNIV